MKKKVFHDLDYLQNKPIIIKFYHVAGPNDLDPIQMYDVIFDEEDLRIRKLNTEDNLIYLREVQK